MSAAESEDLDALFKVAIDAEAAPLKRIQAKMRLMELGALTEKEAFPNIDVPNPPGLYKAPAPGNPRQSLKIVGKVGEREKRKPRAILVSLADIEAREMDWLWPGRFALGSVSMVVGDPSAGKSTVMSAVIATVTTGARWPDYPQFEQKPGSVILLSAEENAAKKVRPRLERFGVDPHRVKMLKAVDRGDGNETQFSLAHDTEALEEAIQEIESDKDQANVRLVVIDPITSYMVGIDENSQTAVRRVIDPLFRMAEARNLAVIMIGHLNKGASTKILYRIAGSIQLGACARMVWYVSKNPKTNANRLLTCAKDNDSELEYPTGLAFRLENKKVKWESAPVQWVADDVAKLLAQQEVVPELDRGARGPAPEEAARAAELVLKCVQDGPMLQSAVFEKALQVGVKESSFRKAVKALVRAEKIERCGDADGKRKWLRLPAPTLPLDGGEPGRDGGDPQSEEAE